ncbi:kinesin-like protein KIF3C [Trichomycterus rosablanca]|uniref:kinesin-like protein KIF3C n=1 Tax=Trichomycterus rosablanca TaxID=2290929 RepID=UPI002F354567
MSGDTVPKDVHQMDRAQNSKSFRVVLHLSCPERSEMQSAEPRASVSVLGANRVTVHTGRGHRVLDFDAVWNEEASQIDVYESTAKPLVEYIMKGYNGCLISYGPFTRGDTHPVQASSIRQRSIIGHAAEDIFNSPEVSHCRVRVSFYHISNEKIYDLLESQVSELCRIHDTEEAVLLEGLQEMEVDSAQGLMEVYRIGTTHRNTGVFKGDFACRSHMVFNIVVINMRAQSYKEGGLMASKLTLVDLASSSKSAYQSPAVLDMMRTLHMASENPQEAKSLKRSLTIFRNVIFSLSTPGCQHVPYRESKLTRVLRDCLGGNCRTCLLATTPAQSCSVAETMSCLQFASQAMNVPSRPIHTSQIHYTPAQVQNMWTAEKNSHLQTRTQILPPVSADRRSQTSLPPIVTSPAALAQPKHKRSLEGSESRPFLPHLERLKAARSRITEEKSGAVDARVVKGTLPVSRCLSGSVFPEALDRLSADQISSSSPLASECPTCKQERKIRAEYDKFIIQVKKDRDNLSQRVTELEKELKNRGAEQSDDEKATGSKAVQTEREDDNRSEKTGGDETGRAEKQWSVGENDDYAGMESTSTSRAATQEAKPTEEEIEPLRDVLNVCGAVAAFKEGKLIESLLSELHSIREEYEGLRKNAAFTITQLQKEKAELISHIDNTKRCFEKVCVENAALKARLEALLNKSDSRPCSANNGKTETRSSHTHMITTDTEMLVVSHRVCQQCSVSSSKEDKGGGCCFNSSDSPETSESGCGDGPPEPGSRSCGPTLHKPSLYKQLRREHSLLLDVMLVLYKREWFLQDAMPYVRRTLKKCGLTLEDTD